MFSPRGISLKKVKWLKVRVKVGVKAGVKVGVKVEVKVGVKVRVKVGVGELVVRVRWTALNTGLAKVKMIS